MTVTNEAQKPNNDQPGPEKKPRTRKPRGEIQSQKALPDAPLEILLTIPDVMQLLQLSRRTIYNLIAQGLPTLKCGKSVRVQPSALRSWLAEQGRVA